MKHLILAVFLAGCLSADANELKNLHPIVDVVHGRPVLENADKIDSALKRGGSVKVYEVRDNNNGDIKTEKLVVDSDSRGNLKSVVSMASYGQSALSKKSSHLLRKSVHSREGVNSWTECGFWLDDKMMNTLRLKKAKTASDKEPGAMDDLKKNLASIFGEEEASSVEGLCYTVNPRMCDEIERAFDKDMSQLAQEQKKCADFVSAFSAKTFGDNLDEESVKSMQAEWSKLHKTDSAYSEKVVNAVSSGSAAKAKDYVTAAGRIIDLCRRVKFVEEQKPSAQTRGSSASSAKHQ